MRGILFGSVSIVSLLSVGLIPFLFTAYAVCLSKSWILFAVSFCKALLFSFMAMGISSAFGSAGWLVSALVLFSGHMWNWILYFLWIRILAGRKIHWSLVTVAFLLTGCIAVYVISPFMASLIDF